MVQINQKWNKILELILEYPDKGFTIREISKETNIPSSTIQRYIKKLKKEGFVSEENRANITPYFRFFKAFFFIDKIYKSGLIDYLIENLNPGVIIVFGSIRKGEYYHDSDIDLFIESTSRKELDLRTFEKKLKHKIQLFIEQDIDKLQPNLFNNVVNGIKLYGSFRVKNA